MKRIFAGIKIEAEEQLINNIDNLKLELRQENIRWVNTENFHITLKFFGDTDEKKILQINTIFEQLAQKVNPFKLVVKDIGYFHREGMPKILWLNTDSEGKLNSLVDLLENDILPIGYNTEKRHYKSHLTIGSIRKLSSRKTFKDIILKLSDVFYQEIMINSFILYESILKPGGPDYKVIYEYKLSGQL